jgi:hypothetical protein
LHENATNPTVQAIIDGRYRGSADRTSPGATEIVRTHELRDDRDQEEDVRPRLPNRTTRQLALASIGLTGLVALSACGDAPTPRNEETALDEWRVSDDIAVSVGEVEGEEAYVLSRVADVALIDDGGVAVADGGSSTVRVYGSDGSVRTVTGGPGDGPGEFRWINQLRHRPPDTLVVFDAEIGRLTTLVDRGRRVGSTTTFRADDGRVEIWLGRFADGSHAMAWIRQPTTERDPSRLTPDRMAIARFTRDGTFAGPLAEESGMRRLGCCPIPFSPHFTGAVLGDVAYHLDGLHAELRRTRLSGDGLTPLPVAMAETSLDAAWDRYQRYADSSDVVRFAEMRRAPGLDSVPAFSDLLVDDEGRLWLKEYDPAVDSHWALRPRTGGHWRVLLADGTPVARVSVPETFRLMDVRGNAVAGLARDDLGVERVEVRSLDRAAAR